MRMLEIFVSFTVVILALIETVHHQLQWTRSSVLLTAKAIKDAFLAQLLSYLLFASLFLYHCAVLDANRRALCEPGL